MAIEWRLYGYFSKHIPLLKPLIQARGIDGRPPLDVALRPRWHFAVKTLHDRYADPRFVSLVLDQGANPNEKYDGDTVWKSFVSLYPIQSDSQPESKPALFDILKMLLVHGSDPTVDFSCISTYLISEDAAQLEDLLGSLKAQRQAGGFKIFN